MRYTVVVHRGEASEIPYGAEVVELPGCYSAGATIEQLETNVREAVALYRQGEEDKYPQPSGFLFQMEVHA